MNEWWIIIICCVCVLTLHFLVNFFSLPILAWITVGIHLCIIIMLLIFQMTLEQMLVFMLCSVVTSLAFTRFFKKNKRTEDKSSETEDEKNESAEADIKENDL